MASVKFAVVDANDYLSKKQASDPELASDWAKLEELYNKKLWHQLTLKLQEFVKHPSLQSGDNLIQLYNNFLTIFENKINPLSLVEIVAHIVTQYADKREAVAFLEKIEAKVKMNAEALALCKVLQGQIYLEHLNDLDATEKIIDVLENTLEDADGVTPVHGRFYKLASEYYRVRGPMARYYVAALRYVGCAGGGANLPLHERRTLEDADGVTPVHGRFYKLASEYYRVRGPMARYYVAALRYVGCAGGGANLPLHERRAAALRLALAAVLAPTVYDLGELLAHPILESLEG
ncbi:26S proteasome non-ATPase regulatory subunit 13 [Danaus plexippus plexippus]|uniref:26S proteasome non-ATPase regulatory subunit 13 n=1 Tax=Danaus plexippus plexippus TaxID=278856 RepID=A0A212FFV5_DANPL|nr:26S proteasome non-ATPase regulatory subunit 13 [Danaus plexippus plexippus]